MGPCSPGGKGGGGGEGERAGMHWGPLKSSDKVQGREAVGAMGHGTMEPWSAMGREGRRGRRGRMGADHEPWSGGEGGEGGHALNPLKSSDRGSHGAWDHGAMERHGAGRAEGMERHGAGRAEGAERAERAGMHSGP